MKEYLTKRKRISRTHHPTYRREVTSKILHQINNCVDKRSKLFLLRDANSGLNWRVSEKWKRQSRKRRPFKQHHSTRISVWLTNAATLVDALIGRCLVSGLLGRLEST